MEKKYIRLPKDFKFESGKNYSLKFKRTEYRFTYEKDTDFYKKEFITVGSLKDTAYVAPADVPGFLDYLLSFADGNGKIVEIR